MKQLTLIVPAPLATTEETPKLTPAQLARRKQMAIILCANAANKNSWLMAKRICASWFETCDQCPYREVSEN